MAWQRVSFISFLFLCACSSSGPKPDSADGGDLKNQILELQRTVRSQNSKIEDLTNRLAIASTAPRKKTGSGGDELSGISLADENAKEMPGPGQMPVPSSTQSSEQGPVSDEDVRKNIVGADKLKVATVSVKGSKDKKEGTEILGDTTRKNGAAEQDYLQAVGLIKERKLDEGVRSLTSFVKKYSQHFFADNALFLLGQIFAQKKEYERALFQFKRIQQIYPMGDKAVSAWLGMGQTLRAMKQEEGARAAFRVIVTKYPGSDEARTAEKALQLSKQKEG